MVTNNRKRGRPALGETVLPPLSEPQRTEVLSCLPRVYAYARRFRRLYRYRGGYSELNSVAGEAVCRAVSAHGASPTPIGRIFDRVRSLVLHGYFLRKAAACELRHDPDAMAELAWYREGDSPGPDFVRLCEGLSSVHADILWSIYVTAEPHKAIAARLGLTVSRVAQWRDAALHVVKRNALAARVEEPPPMYVVRLTAPNGAISYVPGACLMDRWPYPTDPAKARKFCSVSDGVEYIDDHRTELEAHGYRTEVVPYIERAVPVPIGGMGGSALQIATIHENNRNGNE